MKKLTIILFLSSFAFAGLDANLASHYKMNDNDSNTTVIDSKGFSNGTAQRNTSLMHVDGKLNGALSFNGTTDYIRVCDFNSIFQHSFSASLWVDVPNKHTNFILGTLNDNNDLGPTNAFQLRVYGPDPLDPLWLETYYVANEQILSVSTVVEDFPYGDPFVPGWRHIAVTVEQVNTAQAKISLYFNGALRGSATNNCVMPSYQNTQNFVIGGLNHNGTINSLFTGSLDNIMIFNRALSSDEVAWLYNSGSGRENAYSDCNDIRAAGFGLKSDLNGDCYVDFKDFSEFAEEWTQCNEPNKPGCISNWGN